MGITIKDVAQDCGFSITSVSLILNGKGERFPEATKTKVLESASKLGYEPNQIARALITKNTRTIGLIVPDLSNVFFSTLAQKIDMFARNSGYSILIGESSINGIPLKALLSTFISHRVDGIILSKSTRLSIEEEIEIIRFIQNEGIPIVSIDSNISDVDVNSVLVDHEYGGYKATKYLISLNHRKIGCLTGPQNTTTSNDRLLGYKKALKEAGIEFNNNLVYEGDYTSNNVKDALDLFLSSGATAIFAMNDMMALGIYREAYKMKLRIPDDLSIVGFDNIYFSEIVYPQLTTVNQPSEEIAQNTVKLLISDIESSDDEMKKGKKYYLKPNLIVRESTSYNK